MTERLRIAVLAPVWFPVPPTAYGGIEWVVSLLADGLVERGHDVTLFASGDSRTKANLAGAYEKGVPEQIGTTWPELRHALSCYERAAEFDVVNDHSGPLGAVLAGTTETPVLHTLHGPLHADAAAMYRSVVAVAPRLGLISVSRNQRRPATNLPWAANIPNALALDLYQCKPHRGEYLLFLGRMHPDKGAHRAIAIAEAVGIPLKLAGKAREPVERQYFERVVEPRLRPGIEYLGEVGHGEKVSLLQDARVTLFPIDWEEPFGLVMIESMACGTPVIATRRGAVAEVIEHGRSGIIVDDFRDMINALPEVDALDPAECRRYAEERFSPERMVRDYEAAYEAALRGARADAGERLLEVGDEVAG